MTSNSNNPAHINKEANDTMANKTNTDINNFNLDAILDLLADKIASRLSAAVPVNGAADAADAPAEKVLPAKTAAKKTASKKAAAKAEPEVEDEAEAETEDDDAQATRRAELEAMRITSLRKIAKELGFSAEDVAGADKETLVDNIIDDEFNSEGDDEDEADEDETDEAEDADEDEAEDDEDDEAEDDEDGDEDYTRADFEEMSLSELKAIAKDAGYKPADYKGMDQDALISFLLDEEAEDEVEDEDEDETETYTEADLKAMDIKELKALAKEWGVKVKPDAKKGAIVKALLAD